MIKGFKSRAAAFAATVFYALSAFITEFAVPQIFPIFGAQCVHLGTVCHRIRIIMQPTFKIVGLITDHISIH